MELTRRALLSMPRAMPPAPGGHWLHIARAAMACRFEVTLPSELSAYTDAASRALDVVDAVEEELSVFRGGSAVSRLNQRAADGPIPVEPPLFELLRRCRALHDATERAFDVTCGPLSRAWGFLRRAGRVPTADELGEARALVGMRHVRLDAATRTVAFSREGVMLNLGSIGKGYALDRAATALRRARVSTALLSAGASSVLALGGGPDGRGYTVGLRDPLDHRRRLGTVRLRDAALGVSGAGEQFFTADGRRYGHVIDPRTGQPVADRLCAAVVAPDGALADALATAFFVGGRMLAERYVAQYPHVSVVLMDDAPGSAPSSDGRRPAPVIIGSPSPWSFARAQ